MDSGKLNTAINFAKNGNFVQAETLLRNLAVNYPENPDVHNNLAIVLCEQKSFDESISNSKRAVFLSPNRSSYWHTLWKICEIGKIYIDREEQIIFQSLFPDFEVQALSSDKKKTKFKCARVTDGSTVAHRKKDISKHY